MAARQFLKENVLVERPENEKDALFAQKRMSETPARPQIRMLAQQPAGGLHCGEVTISKAAAQGGFRSRS